MTPSVTCFQAYPTPGLSRNSERATNSAWKHVTGRVITTPHRCRIFEDRKLATPVSFAKNLCRVKPKKRISAAASDYRLHLGLLQSDETLWVAEATYTLDDATVDGPETYDENGGT